MKLSKIFNLKMLAFLLVILFFNSCDNYFNQNFPKTEQEIKKEIKDSFNFLPSSTTGQVVFHKYYSLSYNEKYENSEWVAYSLTPKQISYRQIERPYFLRDPLVKTKSAYYKNYYPNGYEKGHLLPAGDRRFSEEAYDETFYTSNVAPMDHYFNSGIWNNMEKQVRYWTKRYGKLYIVTGGILQPGLERIGREQVAVPDYFYKIVLDYKKPGKARMIGFLIPHKDITDDLRKFVVSIDSIEKITGIDFFPALPDSIENRLEAQTHPEQWRFVKFESWQRD